jgi:hypothetical protein
MLVEGDPIVISELERTAFAPKIPKYRGVAKAAPPKSQKREKYETP